MNSLSHCRLIAQASFRPRCFRSSRGFGFWWYVQRWAVVKQLRRATTAKVLPVSCSLSTHGLKENEGRYKGYDTISLPPRKCFRGQWNEGSLHETPDKILPTIMPQCSHYNLLMQGWWEGRSEMPLGTIVQNFQFANSLSNSQLMDLTVRRLDFLDKLIVYWPSDVLGFSWCLKMSSLKASLTDCRQKADRCNIVHRCVFSWKLQCWCHSYSGFIVRILRYPHTESHKLKFIRCLG